MDEVVFTPPPPFIPGTWTLTSNLVSATCGENLVLLTNGMAFAYEGSSNGLPISYLEMAQLFDPIAGTWAATSNPPSFRLGALVVTLQSGIVLACWPETVSSAQTFTIRPPHSGPPRRKLDG